MASINDYMANRRREREESAAAISAATLRAEETESNAQEIVEIMEGNTDD